MKPITLFGGSGLLLWSESEIETQVSRIETQPVEIETESDQIETQTSVR
ncbi:MULTISPECIES: hypothetical protein [Bacillus]|nr:MULTISPECIES: hypothetical protein [Bacillus]